MEFLRKEPHFEARIVEILDDAVPTMGVELEALIRTVKEQVSKSASLGKQISPDILVIINNLDHPGRLADLVASNLHLEVGQGVEILEITNPVERLQRISWPIGKDGRKLFSGSAIFSSRSWKSWRFSSASRARPRRRWIRRSGSITFGNNSGPSRKSWERLTSGSKRSRNSRGRSRRPRCLPRWPQRPRPN